MWLRPVYTFRIFVKSYHQQTLKHTKFCNLFIFTPFHLFGSWPTKFFLLKNKQPKVISFLFFLQVNNHNAWNLATLSQAKYVNIL